MSAWLSRDSVLARTDGPGDHQQRRHLALHDPLGAGLGANEPQLMPQMARLGPLKSAYAQAAHWSGSL
jgi:hypothetical protein